MGGENWVSRPSSRHLRGRRTTDTEPEILLRRALHAAGFRYRLHVKLAAACTPDIVLPKYRMAVFVDGDFWHGCPQHARRSEVRGPNENLWRQKVERNRERDRRAVELAEGLGWKAVRVWECEIRNDVEVVLKRLGKIAASQVGPA